MASVSVRVQVTSKRPVSIKGKKTQAELWLASAVLKDTRPFVPFKTGSLNQRSHVEAGKYIVYPAPYARYLYEGKRMVNAKTGKGAHWVDGLGWRHAKGAKLKATSEPLRYGGTLQPDGNGGYVWVGGNGGHKDATDHWLDASKKKNLEKWLNGVAKILSRGGGNYA